MIAKILEPILRYFWIEPYKTIAFAALFYAAWLMYDRELERKSFFIQIVKIQTDNTQKINELNNRNSQDLIQIQSANIQKNEKYLERIIQAELNAKNAVKEINQLKSM